MHQGFELALASDFATVMTRIATLRDKGLFRMLLSSARPALPLEISGKGSGSCLARLPYLHGMLGSNMARRRENPDIL